MSVKFSFEKSRLWIIGITTILALLILILESGGNRYIDLIKGSAINKKGLTIKQALKNYNYTDKTDWNTYEKDGVRYVSVLVKLKCHIFPDLLHYQENSGPLSRLTGVFTGTIDSKKHKDIISQYYRYCEKGEYVPYLKILWIIHKKIDGSLGFNIKHIYISVYREKHNDIVYTWWDRKGLSPESYLDDTRILTAFLHNEPIPPKYIIEGMKDAITYKDKVKKQTKK